MNPLRFAIAFAGCCLSGVVIWRGVDFSTSPEVVPVVPVVLTERGSWQGGTRSSWSEQDGGAGPGESEGQSPPSTQQRWAVVTRQAANLAKSDPEAAERWALSLAEGERELALATLATELAGFDFEAAGRVAMKMQDTPERNATLSFVSAQWASEDPAAAIEWVRSLPEGPLRAAIERRVVPAVADQDPALPPSMSG
ncbi:hypothetical protein [Verrucomicrobium spinosum]|uniref:hypothetical protein n=1 Tax=Verrucomicrobium spinosum TaxID=2736 RepID=UPI00094667EC|nr:hypothetical protein [Verrucomicrobium spinosum]